MGNPRCTNEEEEEEEELGSDGEPIDGETLGSEDDEEDFIDDEDDKITEEELLEYYNVLGVQPNATLEVFFVLFFVLFNFFLT